MLVSVAIITHNHERYIAQALNSVLAQKINFDLEIIIGVDLSDDKTKKIVEVFSRDNQFIKPYYYKNRVGMAKNFIETINRCTGKYVAYLEGDDYWTSPDKLQNQISLLESDPGMAFCHHGVEVLDDETGVVINKMPEAAFKGDFGLRKILIRNFIGTCSVVFRNGVIRQWPAWISDLKMMDWPLYVLLLEDLGTAGYIDQTMAVYRRHQTGIHSRNALVDNLLNAIETNRAFSQYFGWKYQGILIYGRLRFYYHLIRLRLCQKDFIRAVKDIFLFVGSLFDFKNYEGRNGK